MLTSSGIRSNRRPEFLCRWRLGSLRRVSSVSMVFGPSRNSVYMACQGGGVYGHAFDVNTGMLTALPISPFSAIESEKESFKG